MSKELIRLPTERIETKILMLRGQKVLLDRDLAALYGVSTSSLKRAARRNPERFPEDFMFLLDAQEVADWRCQFGTSNSDRMGLRYAPMAFTEHGVAMLSSVLKSPRAIQVNVVINPPPPPRKQIGFNVREQRATYRSPCKEMSTAR